MVTIGILEHRPILSALLERCLPDSLWETVRLSPVGGVGGPPPDHGPDLLVVSSDLRGETPPPLSCRTLLVPGRLAGLVGVIPARAAVSYGGSPRDSLTFSSFGEDTLALSIQRELVTLFGQRVERQELLLPRRGQSGPFHALACAGVQLLLGVPPEAVVIGPPVS